MVEEDQQQDEHQQVEEDTELNLRVEVEREETCRECGREKAYECFTARHARNVDAFVAELHVLAQVPIMQDNDNDGADNRCEGAGAPEQKEKGVHDACSSFTVLVVFVPVVALRM
jgi:hypothetical protein